MKLAISVFSVLLVGFASGIAVEILTALRKNAGFEMLDYATQHKILDLVIKAVKKEPSTYLDIIGIYNVRDTIDSKISLRKHTAS